MRAKRPRSIRLFEALFYGGLGVIAIDAYVIAINPNAAAVLRTEYPVAAMAFQLGISLAFNLLLLWLIAYRASNIARWLFVGLVCLGIVLDVASFEEFRLLGDLSIALWLTENVFCTIEIFLLFRSDARDWFAGREPVDPEIFS
jgi:hypothetical protein